MIPFQFLQLQTLCARLRMHGRTPGIRAAIRARNVVALTAVIIAGGAIVPAAAHAETPAEFYKGKTVTILVGSPPGGGYDLYARMIAPYLAKKLGAQVIIDNRAGGSGLLALNVLYTARPDGLTLMNASAEGALMSKLTDREGARWDLAKLNWLARVAEEPKLWFVSTHSKIKTLKDALAAPKILWSATGPADNISDVVAVLSKALDLNSKVVPGYKGAKDMSLAVVNGEVDAGILTASSILPLVQSGDVIPVAMISRKRWPTLPNVPTIFELKKIPDDKAWWIDFREKVGQPQRAMVTTPGVPADRVAFLRQTMKEILTDPAVVAEGNKANLAINFMSGEELQKLITELASELNSNRLPEIRQVILKNYFK
jgi:tripartite-type tricarboxylate transporter receptor subunit TctC